MSGGYNEPAFPVQDCASWQYAGMSLLDYFAAQALPAALDMPHNHGLQEVHRMSPMHPELAARHAYRVAEAMLAERDKRFAAAARAAEAEVLA